MGAKKLNENNQKAFLISLHQLIEDSAESTANNLEKGDTNNIFYPPNGGLTEDENKSINLLSSIPNIKSAIRKVLAGNSSKVVFDLLNWFDGTGDPEIEGWSGIALIDKGSEEEPSMLHEQFMGMYWEWMKIRKNKDWKLDLMN